MGMLVVLIVNKAPTLWDMMPKIGLKFVPYHDPLTWHINPQQQEYRRESMVLKQQTWAKLIPSWPGELESLKKH